MKKNDRKILILLTALLFAALSVLVSFGANYTLTGADWDAGYTDRAVAGWDRQSEEKEDRSTYRVRLYRGSLTEPVGNWISTAELSIDFSSRIIEKGKGSYFFVVYPLKGGQEYAVTSPQLEVDSVMMADMKQYAKEKAAAEKANFENGLAEDGSLLPKGWISRPDNAWYYRKEDGKLAKSCFLDIDGKRYFFSSTGRMLTGWQRIDKKWYCFAEDGSLYRNGLTPDGCTVNEDGVWIMDGVPVSTSAKKQSKSTDTSTVTPLSSCTISAKETAAEAGTVKKLEFRDSTEVKVESVTYSVPQEQWIPGTKVSIRLQLEAGEGYSFLDTTEFKCSKATVSGNEGNNTKRTVYLTYTAHMTLKAPTGFYIDGNGILHWDKVENADQYNVKVLDGSSMTTAVNIKQTGRTYDLTDYLSSGQITVKVYALSSQKSLYQNSEAAVITDLAENAAGLTVAGTLSRTEDGRVVYITEDGERAASGWYQLAGNWYHFRTGGYSEAPGWWQDTDGRWYYFDENCRMVTGKRIIEQKEYEFNDGSRTDLPLGAWLGE